MALMLQQDKDTPEEQTVNPSVEVELLSAPCMSDSSATDRPDVERATASVSLVPLYVLALAMPVDEAVVLPSLWPYVQSLGGGAREYGYVLVSYYIGRVVFIPLIGLWLERAPYTRIFLRMLLLGCVASILYTLAPVLGGVWAVALARFWLGVSSTQGVAVLTFMGEHVPAEGRRSAMSRTFGFQRACVPLAPLANLLLVSLPTWHLGAMTFDQYTLAGVFTAVVNALCVLTVIFLFKEPPRAPRPSGSSTPRCPEIGRTIWRSGAYVSYILSFQNNWTNQVFLWTLPIITAQTFPSLKVMGNSVLLSVGGTAGLVTAFAVPLLCSRFSDRVSILMAQAFQGLVLLIMILCYGGCTDTEGGGPPLPVLYVLFCAYNVGFLAQMPANNAIYSKLVGSSNQGIYQALLELSKAIARLISSYTIGEAYESLGPCCLWGLTLLVWALQFVPFLGNWRRMAV